MSVYEVIKIPMLLPTKVGVKSVNAHLSQLQYAIHWKNSHVPNFSGQRWYIGGAMWISY